MPELPEVETVRAGLSAYVLGQQITRVEVLRDYSIRHNPGGTPEFTSRLLGRKIQEVARRGKYIWLVLDDFSGLQVHLGMSGQVLWMNAEQVGTNPYHPHTRVVLHLDEGQMRFQDQRTFGYMFATDLAPTTDALPGGQGTEHSLVPERMLHIARDPFDPHFNATRVAELIGKKNVAIKRLLLDQQVVAGIGNIYADEALWRTRLHYERPGAGISRAKRIEVLEASRQVMAAALEVGGTSFDALYVDADGNAGYFERELQAYGRAGQDCRRCGKTIRRAAFMNRSAFFCPACQRRR